MEKPAYKTLITGLISLCVSFLFILPIGLFAQQHQPDSLKTIAENPNALPAEKASAFYQLAKTYRDTDKNKSLEYALKQYAITTETNDLSNSLNALELIINLYDDLNDFENSLKYGKEAVRIAQELNIESDIAYFSGLCGGLCIKTGDYFEALQNYQQAVSLSKKNHWESREASFLNNIGGVYYLLGDELTALDYYIQAFNLKEKNDDTKKLVPGLINIGGIYSVIGEHEKGLKFLDKALQYATENEDAYYQAKALISLGDVNIKLGRFSTAEKNYKEALRVSEQVSDLTLRANILAKLGSINIKTGHQTEAIDFAKKALAQSEAIGYLYGVSVASQHLGTIYLSMKNYRLAERYFLKALEVSRKINAVENQLDNYKSLTELYRQKGQPAKALANFTSYVNIKDSIFNDESHQKYNAVKAKYEVEKKQQELDHLKLENNLRILEERQSRFLLLGAIGLLVLIVLVVVLIFRQHKVRSLQRTIRLEQKLLRSQLNPHFIFNALTAVQRFIFEKSTLLASDYLGKFSRLIRFILNSSTADAISLADELEFLENYLDLQAARFDNQFKYTIHLDDAIRKEDCFIPPLLIQPLVENAVEHGLGSLNKEGLIRIDFQREQNHLKVTVTDNGVGRVEAGRIASQKRKNHKSLSTSITKERLLYLNKGTNGNIALETIDLTDEQGNPSGTKVVLRLPFSTP
ncbi:MAG: tetratricopeptide repeat protein [Bacteroidales bacterium]|nr:tetratricopeptide repeat protein [Bacteroidales bacterium]